MSKISPALESDGSSILELTAKVGVFNPLEIDCVAELWDEYKHRNLESGYNFLVYRSDDEEILGYACYGPHPLTLGTYDLYWIAVDPEARGRGIGQSLLSQVEAEVQMRGGRLIMIETSDTQSYIPARRLYESSGYRPVASIRDFYAPGDGLMFFSKTVTKN